jgi:hypothetical protein
MNALADSIAAVVAAIRVGVEGFIERIDALLAPHRVGSHWYALRVPNPLFDQFLVAVSNRMTLLQPCRIGDVATGAFDSIEACRTPPNDTPVSLFMSDVREALSDLLSAEDVRTVQLPDFGRIRLPLLAVYGHLVISEPDDRPLFIDFVVRAPRPELITTQGSVYWSPRERPGGVVQDFGPYVARMVIPEDTDVLERLPPNHDELYFYRLHLDMLLFCIQFPHVRRLPLLDLMTGGGSHAIFTTTGAGYHIWPTVWVGGDDCCVLQLLGLLQFAIIPRHPTLVLWKCANWGYDPLGRMWTKFYRRATQIPGDGNQVDEDEFDDDDDDDDYDDEMSR